MPTLLTGPDPAESLVIPEDTLEKIAENARKAELDRVTPAENIEMLESAGLMRAFQPAAYGGSELLPSQYCPALIDVAKACASTAWAAGLLAQHSHALALFSPELQDEIWSSDRTALASSSVTVSSAMVACSADRTVRR